MANLPQSLSSLSLNAPPFAQGSVGAANTQANIDRKMQSAEMLVLDLSNPDRRENALLELSKVPSFQVPSPKFTPFRCFFLLWDRVSNFMSVFSNWPCPNLLFVYVYTLECFPCSIALFVYYKGSFGLRLGKFKGKLNKFCVEKKLIETLNPNIRGEVSFVGLEENWGNGHHMLILIEILINEIRLRLLYQVGD